MSPSQKSEFGGEKKQGTEIIISNAAIIILCNFLIITVRIIICIFNQTNDIKDTLF